MTHRPEILPGDETFFQHASLPFDLGVPDAYRGDMARQIRWALKGERGASVGMVEEKVEIDGRTLARFTLGLANGDATYLVDPNRGWAPIEKHGHVKNGTRIDIYYDDVRLVPGRGWLPFISTTHFDGTARRIVVRDADFDTVPKSSEFDLEFPEPRAMVNVSAGLWYRQPRKTWNLSSLPSPSSAKTEKIKSLRVPTPSASPGAGRELPGEREPWPWYLGPVAFSAIGVAGVVLAIRACRR